MILFDLTVFLHVSTFTFVATYLLLGAPVRGVALPEPARIPFHMADHAVAVREPGQPAEGTVAEHPQGIH